MTDAFTENLSCYNSILVGVPFTFDFMESVVDTKHLIN